MKNINERLQKLYDIVSSSSFANYSGLGNDVNFHIFDYDAADEYFVREYVMNYLTTKKDLNIQIFNIYDIIIEILKEKGFLEKTFEFEKTKGCIFVNEVISKTLGINSSSDLVVQHIKNNFQPDKIIIIMGIGSSWPLVRGHALLNNLQSIITKTPLLMLYPGKYDQKSFSLFGQLTNENYYRAFQIVSRK